MLPFGFIKILFGKIFWNKVVKKRRKKRSYWRASRCNPLKDKDVVFQNSGYPPCRRLRSYGPPDVVSVFVIRRVGGLEVLKVVLPLRPKVIRRVGGLEASCPVS